MKLGESKVSGLYLGGEKIGKAYLGEAVVFAGKKPSRLPEGYTEVEYIQSDNECSINTQYPYMRLNGTRIIVDIEAGEYTTGTENIFGFPDYIMQSGSPLYFTTARITQTNVARRCGEVNSVGMYVPDFSGNRCTVDLNGYSGYFSVGSRKTTFTTRTNYKSNSPGARLFSLYDTGKSISAKLYSAQIYMLTNLAADLIPCINPYGEAGLYDLLRNEFYGNSGAGVLTAGPAV